MQENAFFKDLQLRHPNGLLKYTTHICDACDESFKTKKISRRMYVK